MDQQHRRESDQHNGQAVTQPLLALPVRRHSRVYLLLTGGRHDLDIMLLDRRGHPGHSPTLTTV